MTGIQLGTPLRLDHLAIWVADMEKTTGFLTDIVGFKRHPMVVEVSADDPTCGGMEAVFIDCNGLWLELILPTSEGPGMDLLRQKGDGAIVEVNFEAIDADYMAIIDDMASKDIEMLAMDGSPLVDGGRIDEGVRGKDDTKETGQRIAYWPLAVSRGTTIEVYEKLSDDETNLLHVRDEMWRDEKTAVSAPRADRVSILVTDLDKSAEFYTTVMGLKRHPADFVVDAQSDDTEGVKVAFIEANGVWVQLIQPISPGHAMDLLTEHGDGYAMEIGIEVNDLNAYYDQVQSKGITLVNFDGSALAPGSKAVTAKPYGDRYGYFPLQDSRGLRIAVYERGPRDTSLLHRRDDTFQK